MNTKQLVKTTLADVLFAVIAGVIVGTAYHFFQNSNGFAPGGVGGHRLLQERKHRLQLLLQ